MLNQRMSLWSIFLVAWHVENDYYELTDTATNLCRFAYDILNFIFVFENSCFTFQFHWHLHSSSDIIQLRETKLL